jgi:c-di-GMP-binding flagellar brake protein YcgR
MAMTNVERRKLFRIEVVAPIRFQLIDETTSKPETDWMNGSTVDVSLGGFKVTAPMPEEQVEELVDDYVLIEFSCQLPGAAKAVGATANIVYFMRGAPASKDSTVTFGLSFVTIDGKAKDVIGEFIRRRINSPAQSLC